MNNCHQCEYVLDVGQHVCPSCGAQNPKPAETEPEFVADMAAPMETEATIPAPVTPPVPVPVTRPAPAARSNSGSNRGMTTSTKAWIAIGIAVAFAAGLIFWQFKGRHNRIVILTTLTAEDMKMLVADMPPQVRQQLATDPKARKEFADQMKQILALASEARSSGVGEKPESKEQLELMRSLIVADLYEKKQGEARGPSPAFADIKDEDIKAFVAEQGQEEKFKHFVQVAQKMGLLGDKELPEEQQKQLKDEWAKVMITERKAVKAGFDQQRNIQLHIAFQQARFLAQQYAKDTLEPKVKATDAEIDAYVAAHPELDDAKVRASAEDVLKRVRAGEDFAALAKQYSSDPSNKDTGGVLDWFGRGQMDKGFEEVAFKLQPGQISDVVQTPYGFHIIKVDGRRTEKNKEGKDEEQVLARHILISTGAKSDNQMGPPQSGRETAKAAVEKDKRDKMLADITKRNKITVAENFEVEAPPAPKQPQFPGMPPGGEMQQGPPPGSSGEEIVPPGPNTKKGGKGKQPAAKSGGR